MPNTVWKLHNFPVTQILREIKVGKFRVSKTTTLKDFRALNFDFHGFLQFLKAEIDQFNKS